jgi:hypothetical protein
VPLLERRSVLTTIAVFLAGIWLILHSATSLSSTATLVFGIVIAALALIDLLSGRVPLVPGRAP